MSIIVDDTSPAIVYSGSWQVLTGNSNENDGGVHSTTQTGASATISFTGTQITMFDTNPVQIGDGSVASININFDGQLSSLTRDSHLNAFYHDIWFDSGTVSDSEHTLIVSNAGGASDSPFELDYFSIDGAVVTPAVATPTSAKATTTAAATVIPSSSGGSSSSSSSPSSSSSSSSSRSSSSSSSSSSGTSSTVSSVSSSGEMTVTAVQYITTAGADGSVVTQISPGTALTSSSKLPIAAIFGALLGGLLPILFLLVLLLCSRRRRKEGQHVALVEDAENHLSAHPRNTTTVIPFQLDANGMEVAPKYTSSPAISSSTATSALGAGGTSTSAAAYHAGSSIEKDPNFFSNSNSSPTSESVHTNTSPSHDTHAPVLPELDAGPYRPRYLSGDTLREATSSFLFASTMLAPQDTNDIPPSYQSARNHDSISHVNRQSFIGVN